MSLFSNKPTKKWLKIVGYGYGGTGKTTFGTTMPGPRYWVDGEHSGDHIRNNGDMVLYTTSFKDLQDAQKEACGKASSFIVDPITIFRDALIDKVESETKDGLQFRDWTKIKKPDKRFTTDWQNMPAHVYETVHEKDEFEMHRNDRGKLEPVKVGVKPDADKKLIYAPDIVLRFTVENGKHYATIEKIRIRKDLAIETGLTVGKKIENPTFDHFKPIADAYAEGEAPAHYSDDRETSEKDDQVFEELDREQEEAQRKKLVGQIQRGEKKCRELKIYGWVDDEQIGNTRTTAMGTDKLQDCAVSDLEAYRDGLKNTVLRYQEEQKQEA